MQFSTFRFNYILNELNPKIVCKGMGLCPNGENQDFLTSDEESGPITLLLTPPELTEEENQLSQEGGISKYIISLTSLDP